LPFQATVKNRQRRVRLSNKKINALANLVLHSAVDVLKRARQLPTAKRKAIAEFDRRGILDIAMVSDRQMKDLNCKWRDVNSTTDVLSFPLGPPVANLDIPFEIGQIVISVERAIKQARMYNHSVDREMAFLLTHGFLHVIGFDHNTKKKESEMFRLQRKVLDKAGIRRDL
jgi:probable rRNA maturation factor